MSAGNEIIVGHVETLTRYPVKSMRGEPAADIVVTARGLAGDRIFAAIDEATGKIASAKRPKLWRGLLACGARLAAGGAEVTLPDGRHGLAGEAWLDEALSAWLGRPVRLTAEPPAAPELDRAHPEAVLAEGAAADVGSDVLALGAGAPPGTFFDFAALHIVTTATLASLSAGLTDGAMEPERYRANILIRSPAGASGFPENAWTGGRLRVGEVTAQVVLCSPRCAIPTLAQGPLPARPAALRAAMERNVVDIPGFGRLPCAGVYAMVAGEGRVRAGDKVTFTPA